MPYSTIQQISDALDLHTVQISAAQGDADFAQSEAARALSTIYQTGLDANVYTDTELQRLKDEIRLEYQAADDAKDAALQAAINSGITSSLPGLLNGYYGPYAGMQALYDALLTRFDQSDAALDDLLNNVFPGLQSDVTAVSTLANQVDTNFTALQDSLKSVLVVYADDAAGANQSLTAGTREFVQYVEYNGTPPALPVSGTFIKFVGTPQSVWPIYAADAAGNNQSFEPTGRDYVTFYESILVPELPVTGQTFVKYVGEDGAAGGRGPGIWWISVGSLPANSTAAQNAWNTAPEVSGAPELRDQVWFYTGSQDNPTGQKVFICQTVTSETSHTWDHQEHVLRGDLLVSDSVTAAEINSNGLSIYDSLGNIILQATGGSAGIDISKVLNRGAFSEIDAITSGNVSTFIANAAILNAQLGNASVNYLKIAGNSATFADFSSAGGVAGNGSAIFRGFVDFNVPAFQTVDILICASFSQGYSVIPTGWKFEIGGGFGGAYNIIVDRTSFMTAAADYPTVTHLLQSQFNNSSLSRNFRVDYFWTGQNSNISLIGSTLSVFARMR